MKRFRQIRVGLVLGYLGLVGEMYRTYGGDDCLSTEKGTSLVLFYYSKV